MNFERIRSTINVERMLQSHMTLIGGGYGVACDLARSGLGAVTFVEFDHVGSSNPARQDLDTVDIGRSKAEATADRLRRINPEIDIEIYLTDFCALSREQIDEMIGQTDLVIDAADAFPPHARVNLEVTRLRKPALWVGMYAGARAGEIIHWHPEVTPACYRCICGTRYAAFTQGRTRISSDGGTIHDLRIVDGIAGQIAVGLLTRGADNRMGRLIDQLGNRNLLQVKLDPEYRLGERDIFGTYLGNHPANFSFTTIALPMEADPDCPDCSTLPVTAAKE